jgi:tetratricopeptide (TPR) repeat protein
MATPTDAGPRPLAVAQAPRSGSRRTGRRAAVAVVLIATFAGAALAEEPRALPAPIAALGLDEEELSLWREGNALEESESLVEANACYERLARAHPSSAFLAWRIARNHWRAGERMPRDRKSERQAVYADALAWAERGMAADPECGECVFWKLSSLGRLATTAGAVRSASMARPIADLIDRAIALQPSYADNEWNHTLGNVYYASAAFYRLLPDWPWLDWMIGVHGDKDRALGYIEKALAITPDRVDYNLEYGVVLTCIGREREDADALDRGRQALLRARGLPRRLGTDATDQRSATRLLDRPELACGYSRDGFIDFSGVARAGAF